MKRYILIAVLLVSITGCSAEVPPKFYKWAERVCKPNDGLRYLEGFGLLWPNAICNNGAKFKSNFSTFEDNL